MIVMLLDQFLVVSLLVILVPAVTSEYATETDFKFYPNLAGYNQLNGWQHSKTGKTLCFCNSRACVQSVCETERRCYVRLVETHTAHDGNSTWVKYGCEEELEASAYSCHAKNSRSDRKRRHGVLCCKDSNLCNMPNLLRAAILDAKKPEAGTPPSTPDIPSNLSSVPALQLASVIVPSLLIILVVFLSLCVFYKLFYNMRKFNAREWQTTRRIPKFVDKKCQTKAAGFLNNMPRKSTSRDNLNPCQVLQNPGAQVQVAISESIAATFKTQGIPCERHLTLMRG